MEVLNIAALGVQLIYSMQISANHLSGKHGLSASVAVGARIHRCRLQSWLWQEFYIHHAEAMGVWKEQCGTNQPLLDHSFLSAVPAGRRRRKWNLVWLQNETSAVRAVGWGNEASPEVAMLLAVQHGETWTRSPPQQGNCYIPSSTVGSKLVVCVAAWEKADAWHCPIAIFFHAFSIVLCLCQGCTSHFESLDLLYLSSYI